MFAAKLLGCEGDGIAGVGSGGGVVAVSAYMGRTRGSGVLASTGDVLEMSVVSGVCGVCGMCLARSGVGGVGGEWVIGLGLDFTNSGGTWGKWDMCLWFGCGGVCGVGGEWVGGLCQGLGQRCHVMFVCVVSLDYLC